MTTTATTTSPHLDDDLLNAWLDGETTEAETRAILAHLPECERCQEHLASLRDIKTLLAGLPAATLPRSFTLTAEQASSAKPEPTRSNIIRLLPVTRVLGIAAVIAFLVLGAANAFGPVSNSFRDSNDTAPSGMMMSATGTGSQSGASEEAEQAAAAPEAPRTSMRAIAPGDVVDRGISATSSNDMLDAVGSSAPESSGTGISTLRAAWYVSGALAVVLIVAWAGVTFAARRETDHA